MINILVVELFFFFIVIVVLVIVEIEKPRKEDLSLLKKKIIFDGQRPRLSRRFLLSHLSNVREKENKTDSSLPNRFEFRLFHDRSLNNFANAINAVMIAFLLTFIQASRSQNEKKNGQDVEEFLSTKTFFRKSFFVFFRRSTKRECLILGKGRIRRWRQSLI